MLVIKGKKLRLVSEARFCFTITGCFDPANGLLFAILRFERWLYYGHKKRVSGIGVIMNVIEGNS
jgi:hypothetical protein